jgi:hypothetical protein
MAFFDNAGAAQKAAEEARAELPKDTVESRLNAVIAFDAPPRYQARSLVAACLDNALTVSQKPG